MTSEPSSARRAAANQSSSRADLAPRARGLRSRNSEWLVAASRASRTSHQTTPKRGPAGVVGGRRLALVGALLLLGLGLALAQTSKGRQQPAPSNPLPQSPGTQVRQQQQQQQPSYQPAARPGQAPQTKSRRPQQSVEQQQLQPTGPTGNTNYQQRVNDADEQPAGPTEDPLANSEPALYGSVAGQPGVDFPGYTRIPKTSFTCEGKGFDFGFYADEEAGCQVYHVCWSGRRESFLCGVGTVFNQAILACDYWHSVDCSKSSQFYGVNSELGKAGAEPASGASSQLQRANGQRQAQPSPASSSSALGSPTFGEPISQRRTGAPANEIVQQQQQQTAYNPEEAALEQPQQPVVQQQVTFAPRQPSYASQTQNSNTNNNNNNFAPQRSYEPAQQQQQPLAGTKAGRRFDQPPAASAQAPPVTTTTLATPAANLKGARQQQQVPVAPVAQRFSMDLSQKVNSLIESPVRAPLKASAAAGSKQRQQQQQVTTTRRPAGQQVNYAQLAVARAQQAGSRTAGSAGRKGSANSYARQEQQRPQQQQFDAELDEPQQQQQQQQVQTSTFDDSPVQTSTVQSIANNNNNNNYNRQQQQQIQVNDFGPQQGTIVQSGGNSADGSSAITMQYDSLVQQSGAGSDSGSYESSLDDSTAGGLDDFRSAGAKAAASHNQNWYIMRAI